jgi:hypothetical protein
MISYHLPFIYIYLLTYPYYEWNIDYGLFLHHMYKFFLN